MKTSLKIFLHSLPNNSYFQLIGFDDGFNKYNETPIEFLKNNRKKMDELIITLEANMASTNILSPLQHIFNYNYQ